MNRQLVRLSTMLLALTVASLFLPSRIFGPSAAAKFFDGIIFFLAALSASRDVKDMLGAASRSEPEPERPLDDLADSLLTQWSEEWAARQRELLRPMDLGWRSADAALSSPPAAVLRDSVGGRPIRLRFHGSLSDLALKYKQLPAPRQLIIVGEPGSGKTVFAIKLVNDLLSAHARDVGARPLIPVELTRFRGHLVTTVLV